MKTIKQSYELLDEINGEEILKRIEKIARVCYKSEDKMTENSCFKFVKMLVDKGHHAMLEHVSISVKFITDRGVSHELVRHRLASYAQESTRYCNYLKNNFGAEITVIEPVYLVKGTQAYCNWFNAGASSEKSYFELLEIGLTAQEARAVLTNSTKTEIVVTANLREWMTILKLRTSEQAHPQMRALMIPLLQELQEKLNVIFGGI